MSEAKVGAETQAYCTTCRTMREHVIVAMVDKKPAKVECTECHKQHLFRAGPPGAAKAAGADIDIVAVNDLTDPKTLAHLFKYDSILGPYPGTVEATDGGIVIDGDEMKVFAERDPGALDWDSVGAEVVIESTGFFTKRDDAAKHLGGPVKKVVISAPASGEDITLVLGVNFDAYDKDQHHVISNASCTTNCLVPVVKVLNDAVGIEKGFMTTIHSYTGDQPTLDTMHKDLYRARAAAMSQIPTSTGAAKAVGLVLPELKGKLDGSSIRVPTPNVSVIDFKFHAKKKTSVQEINDAVIAASKQHLKGILAVTDQPNVSIDFNHDPHSSTFALDQTKVMEGDFVRILSWYDNEWGFSNRMSDTAVAMAKLI